MADDVKSSERENKILALVAKLNELRSSGDVEGAHWEADRALLDFIGDQRVTDAFDAIDKWYA